MTPTQAMDALLSEIVQRAENSSWSFAREARFENLTQLESATLLQALQVQRPNEAMELPSHRAALLLRGCIRVLVAAFGEQQDLLSPCRKALWWAGLVRGSLQPIARADLHLFVIATPASGRDEFIRRDRSRIEADERICRKQVWLSGIDGNASEFLDSTFLANPWQRDALAPQSLDPLQRLVETAGLAPEVATKWIAALSAQDDLRADTLAELLSGLYESGSGG